MLGSLFNAGTFSVNLVLITMVTTFLFGAMIAASYMLAGPYRKNFVVILTVLPMLVSMIIMIVNGNVGASVAVLGAFGLVRFRSAPGSARDIGYIFFAMAIGLTTGMGFISLAAILTVIIGGIMVILQKSTFGKENDEERTLRITVPEDLNYTGAFDDVFKMFTSKARLLNVRTTNMGTMFELRYEITLLDGRLEKPFIDALRCRNGNLTIIFGLAQCEKELL